MACLVYPRRLCIEVGKNDSTFLIENTRKEISHLREMSAEISNEWLDYIEFDGDHEFCRNDMPLRRLADDLRGIRSDAGRNRV